MSTSTPLAADAITAFDIADDTPSNILPLGEGGQVADCGVCTLERNGRLPVAIIGGTGYVGRLLARRLLSHPTMCLGFIVGSKRSEGQLYQDVWEEKEAALMKNYGSQLWSAMPFPPQLEGVKVASLEAVLESDCKIAISCVAPDVGYIEDILTNGGVKVYSISPYKRSENLTVPEVNPAQIPSAVDKMLFKSPNCVSVGTSLGLKAIDDAFGLLRVSICTFQSLSGRGDAMYPAELVQGNIYPVWNTKERTEVYIGNEICALVNCPLNDLTVRAHRVGVHIGHFVDVRVKVRCPELITSVEAVNKAFEAFAPLKHLYGPEMPSLPSQPLKVIREVGAPRPATHNNEFGGMQVAVGNIKLDDGVWDVCFSLVVNNMIRGAYGAALLMAEYHLYLQAHPDAAKQILAQHRHLDPDQVISPSTAKGTSPASVVTKSITLPAPKPTARSNTLVTAESVAKARTTCESDPASYHADVAKRNLHWYHPTVKAWLTFSPEGKWVGWSALDGSACELEDSSWSPWRIALDDGKAPWYEWFVGAKTSAAFNEVDRHVLAGHGDETAFICAGPAALEAGIAGGSLVDACTRISRKELLAASAFAALTLKEAGIGAGDRVVFLLPHCIEQMVWIAACKRVGAIYTCMPESISIASLAGRIFDAQASLAVVSSASKASTGVGGTSHKAMASHAIMHFVSMEAVIRAIKRVLPEQRWRSQSGHVDIRNVCDAIETSFKGDGAVSPKEVAAKLEVIFSMQPPLREKAEQLATHLQEEMIREHAARVKTRMLVIPPPASLDGKASGADLLKSSSQEKMKKVSSLGDVSAVGAPATERMRNRNSPQSTAREFSGNETAAQLGALVSYSEDVQAKILPSFLSAAGVDSYEELLKLPDAEMVNAVWKAGGLPIALPSMHPKNFVYTSGSSGYKATGLVQDVGGYTSGVANTMAACFDATPGVDVIFTDAQPSWVTGQTYGITGPLAMRVTSVLCSGMQEGTMAQSLAALVQSLKVTIFVASASFLKRALKNTWQAAWLQRQKLSEQLRVAASCGEPLSPAMHKLGMAVLTPNYINSYWASEHGAIILASSTFGNVDQPMMGDASMHPLPWVGADVWVPIGDTLDDGRTRFKKAEATDIAAAEQPAGASAVKNDENPGVKGRLVVTRPWPSMARTVWGDPDMCASAGWVGDLDTYRGRYWSTFARDDGEPVMALDLADLARPWANGAFSVLGHSREELRLGKEGDYIVAAAELEAVILATSADVIDCCVVALPDPASKPSKPWRKPSSIPIACLVLPESTTGLTEEMTNSLKKSVHEALGPMVVPEDFVQIPAIPRTHNAKPMRQVVQRLFLNESGTLNDVSEIANPGCLLELKASVDEWRFQQALPQLDERC